MSIRLDKLQKNYGKNDEIKVLKGIDLEIQDGEICVLLGPSGSGKSTILNLIGGIDSPSSGKILIEDKDIGQMNEKALTKHRREKLGYIFQLYNLVPTLTVRENIESGHYLGKDPIDVDELLEILGLTDQQNKLPTELSGGQQQRTSIGRAIAKNPEILLCDEPTGALDYKTSKEIIKLLVDINRKYNTTIILVTHNDAFRHIADHVVELHDGRIRRSIKNEDKLEVEELDW